MLEVGGHCMKCKFCGSVESKVVDSRQSEEGLTIRRRRECCECAKRFTTYETIETAPTVVIKKSGARQTFSAAKFKQGIIRACDKRPVAMSDIDKLVSDIEKKIANQPDNVITSTQLGNYALEGLKKLDEVAYVRFAAVYRQLQDIDSWLKLITDLKKNK